MKDKFLAFQEQFRVKHTQCTATPYTKKQISTHRELLSSLRELIHTDCPQEFQQL
jgi:hypothetical protein